MNSTFDRAESALLMPAVTSRSRDLQALCQEAGEAHHAALSRGIRAIFSRFAEVVHRRRAIAELRSLTDRELADIGLQRAEIAYVFDRALASTPVAAAPNPARGMRAANDAASTSRAAA